MDGINLLPLFVSNLKGLSRKEKNKHLEWMAQSVDFSKVRESDLAETAERFFALEKNLVSKCSDDVKAITEICEKKGIDIISIYDSRYPLLLKEIYDPPVVLFCRGIMPEPESLSVSVVGTRHATGKALRAAFETGFQLSLCGINVVSGLAMGIDAEAHNGSIMSGGRTTAVLGSGVDKVYPVCNRKTAEGIIATGGAIISEYSPGTLPLKYHFPERNRIISGLSAAVIIIEAPSRSGALITVDYALEHGRDVFVHEEGLSTSRGLGGKNLADDGAAVFKQPEDICEYYGYETAPYRCRLENNYFDNPGFAEDEIKGLIVNYRGVLYRRKVYA